jgi:acyl carrier protein
MDINIFVEKFASLFDNTDASMIGADTNFRSLEEWDSMIALSLIALVDDEIGVRLTGDDIRSSNTVTDLYKIVSSKV